MSGAGWSFSAALSELKAGRRVYREGWNGKGMFLVLVQSFDGLMPGRDDVGCTLLNAPGRVLPWIGMKTADGGFVPWLASQTDLLAEDWWVLS